jgi:serine/threonine-protein kinase
VLRELIARGGMGEVWRAEDPVLSRSVAVKVLLPGLAADPSFAARFQSEARAMAALSDPGIVEVYDYGQTDGVAYLVMPFVDGESLHDLLNRAGPLPPRETMGVVAQAASALQLAHRSGIVHRDVKPGNLLVRADGRIVLTDFGIARAVEAEPVTAAGGLIGTAAYLAPEQISGGRVAPATDVYALGVVAYECLTLTRPFVADSPVGVALMHTRDEPPPLPDTVPLEVRHVVMRALAKDPDQRWPSARAMAEAATDASRGLPVSDLVAVSYGTSTATAGRFTGSATVKPRPAPTAMLPPFAVEPRRRVGWWAGLAAIAAGVVLFFAATALVLASADSPSGPAARPASVSPGDGAQVGPQQTDVNEAATNNVEKHGVDGRGGHGGDGGDDHSGPG